MIRQHLLLNRWHNVMRTTHLILATSLTVSLSAGCSAQNGDGMSWNAILQSYEQQSPEQKASELRSFRARFAVPEREKREAAYMLARLIQANPQLASSTGTETTTTTQSSSSTQSAGTAQSSTVTQSSVTTQATTGDAMPSEAAALFQESARIDTLHDRSISHAIEAATAAGDEPLLRKLLEEKRSAYPKEPAKRAQYDYALAQSYFRTQEYDQALPIFTKIRTAAPDSSYAIAAGYYLGDAAFTGHNAATTPEQAIQYFRDYIKENPDGRFARSIVSRLKDLANKQDSSTTSYTPTTGDHELFGQVYFSAGDSKDALAEWRNCSPDIKLTHRAICLARTGKIEEAKQTLLEAIKVQPSRNYAPTASLICNYLTREQAKKFWGDILQAKPEKADAALWNIALRSDPPESITNYRKIITTYPTSEFAPEAIWWSFWNLAKRAPSDQSVIPQAFALAHEGVTRYPETRAAERLAFWSGKLHELQKKFAQAAVDYRYAGGKFPASYYGYRAKARLATLPAAHSTNSGAAEPAEHKVKDPAWSTHPGRADTDTAWQWPAPEQILNAKEIAETYGPTMNELVKLKQFEECIELLPDNAGPEFKAALLAKDNRPMQAINAAKNGLTGSASHSTQWQMSYPLVFAAEVKSEATAKGVDPFLVQALIREESRYNHKAISRSNAIGLMQLLPGTAYGVAKRLGVPVADKQDFFKPAINIKLGTDYLSYVLGRYSGNALFAVASYNGGPNAVRSWLNRHEASGVGDLDYFVENIPVRETRDYVRKVFGSYWNYATIYGGTTRPRS